MGHFLSKRMKKKKSTNNNMTDIHSDNEELNEIEITESSNSDTRVSNPAFDTLIEALYDAGIKANRNIQISNLYHLDWYFENFNDVMDASNDVNEIQQKLNENILQPRMIKIRVPNSDSDTDEKWKIVEIPLFTLVKHNSLKIDTMDVELKFNVGQILKKTELNHNKFHSIKSREGKPLIKKKWKMRIATPVKSNSDYGTLKIKFSFDQPLESITRLTERYDRFL